VLIGRTQVCATGDGGERCAEPNEVRRCQTVQAFVGCQAKLNNRRGVYRQKYGLRYVKTPTFCTCGFQNRETVQDRWLHAAKGLESTELYFHSCNVLRDCHRGVPMEHKK